MNIEQAHETARLNLLLKQLEQQKIDMWLGPYRKTADQAATKQCSNKICEDGEKI